MELTDQDIVWAKQTIQKTGLFNTCSQDEICQLIAGLEKETYKAPGTIIFQGEISSRLYLVQSGLVSVTVRTGSNKVKVAELGENSFFGEISLLMPRAATATVKAEKDTEIFILPGEVVQALVKKNPALSEIMNKKIQERLDAQKKQEK